MLEGDIDPVEPKLAEPQDDSRWWEAYKEVDVIAGIGTGFVAICGLAKYRVEVDKNRVDRIDELKAPLEVQYDHFNQDNSMLGDVYRAINNKADKQFITTITYDGKNHAPLPEITEESSNRLFNEKFQDAKTEPHIGSTLIKIEQAHSAAQANDLIFETQDTLSGHEVAISEKISEVKLSASDHGLAKISGYLPADILGVAAVGLLTVYASKRIRGLIEYRKVKKEGKQVAMQAQVLADLARDKAIRAAEDAEFEARFKGIISGDE